MEKIENIKKPNLYLLKFYLSKFISSLILLEATLLFAYIVLVYFVLQGMSGIFNNIMISLSILYAFISILISLEKNAFKFKFMLNLFKINDYYYMLKNKNKNKNINNNINNELNIYIDPTNKNILVLTQNKKTHYIAIPYGVNRTDIFTDKELIDGYNYNTDAIIIMNDSITRKVYYKNKLQLTQTLNN